jgi:hypothetical protein
MMIAGLDAGMPNEALSLNQGHKNKTGFKVLPHLKPVLFL